MSATVDAVVVNHLLVMRLRQAVAEAMAAEGGVARLDLDARRAFTQSLVAAELGPLRQEFIRSGRPPLGGEEEAALAAAVDAAMFGALRFGYGADDPSIENLIFRGAEHVVVYRCDNTIAYERSPFTSSADLCNEAEELMIRCGSERAWNDATAPFVDLHLPDNSRFSGVRGCGEPTVFIRRPRVFDMDLSDMVANGTIDELLHQFLGAAAGAAGHTLVFAGVTDSGKTTMVRAAAHCFGVDEHVVTIENVRELGLKLFTARHRNVTECEAVPPNTEGNGGISIADWVTRSLRMMPSRIINGEVLGDEVVPMLKALSNGHPGMTTVHAKWGIPEAVVLRLCSLAGSAPEKLPYPNTEELVATAIDFVVMLRKIEDLRRGRFYRTVSAVYEVGAVRDGNHVRAVMSPIFDAGPDGRARPTGTRPDRIDQLAAAGFDPGCLLRKQGAWR